MTKRGYRMSTLGQEDGLLYPSFKKKMKEHEEEGLLYPSFKKMKEHEEDMMTKMRQLADSFVQGDDAQTQLDNIFQEKEKENTLRRNIVIPELYILTDHMSDAEYKFSDKWDQNPGTTLHLPERDRLKELLRLNIEEMAQNYIRDGGEEHFPRPPSFRLPPPIHLSLVIETQPPEYHQWQRFRHLCSAGYTNITSLDLKSLTIECLPSTLETLILRKPIPEVLGTLCTLKPDLMSLTRLELTPIERGDLVFLPVWFGKLDLKELCLRTHEFPKEEINKITQISTLTTLNLSINSLTSLPHSIGGLKALTELDLEGCENLISLPECIGNLTSLTELNLNSCYKLASLPEPIGQLTNLQTLNFSGDKDNPMKLESLPDTFCECKSLTSLNLRECKSLVSLPDSIGDLTSLTKLDLQSCSGLVSLPERIGDLTSLTKLDLQSCSSLVSLPERIGDLTSLTKLDLQSCSSLVSLPDRFGECKALKTLNLEDCHKLESLPDSIGDLTSLTELNLGGCVELMALPEGFGELNLTGVSFSFCKKLDLGLIFDVIFKFESLTKLGLAGLEFVDLIIPPGSDIGDLTSLTELDLSCTKIRSLPAWFGELPSLTKLTLPTGLADKEDTYVNLSSISTLTSLNLNWTKIRSLPARIGDLKALTKLDLHFCRSLVSLPERFGECKALKTLNLKWCKKLVSLPDSIGELKALQTLNLEDCRKLESLPDSIGECKSLTTLALWKCNSLVSLPQRIGELKALQTLNLEDCRKLESLPDSIGECKSLTTLALWKCNSLVSLPQRIGELKSLKTLYVPTHMQNDKFPSDLRRVLEGQGCKIESESVGNQHLGTTRCFLIHSLSSSPPTV